MGAIAVYSGIQRDMGDTAGYSGIYIGIRAGYSGICSGTGIQPFFSGIL